MAPVGLWANLAAVGAALLVSAEKAPPVTIFRVTPDPGVVAEAPSMLQISFNQPVQEGTGDLTIDCGAQHFAAGVRSPKVWVGTNSQAGGATVSFHVPPMPMGTCRACAPAGAFVSAMGGTPSPSHCWVFYIGHVSRPDPDLPAVLQHHPLPTLDLLRINKTIAHLSLDYYNRFFASASGAASAEWLAREYERLAKEAGRPDVQVERFSHAWQMPSIIVRIPGSKAAADTVIVGAHLDSINRQNWTENLKTGRAPGANDDGSAIALQLEVFRNFLAADFRPERTVELHAYSAEEEGLYGSADVAAEYARFSRNVFAMLQLDQCGYVSDPANPRIAVYTDNTHEGLRVFLTRLIDSYCSIPWEWSNEQHRADSDFHSWHNHGFPASYAAEGPVDDIVYGNNKHTPGDEISGVNLPHTAEFGRLMMGFILELAATPTVTVLYT